MVRRRLAVMGVAVLVALGVVAGWWAGARPAPTEPEMWRDDWDRPLRLTAAVVEMRLTHAATERALTWPEVLPEATPPATAEDGTRKQAAATGTPATARLAVAYDCAGALTAGRGLIVHRDLLCWLALPEGAPVSIAFYTDTLVTTWYGGAVWLLTARAGETIHGLSNATLRPLAAGWEYESIRELEIMYHSPAGGGPACLRDADHGNMPLTSLCPDAMTTPPAPVADDAGTPQRMHHAATFGTGVLMEVTVSDGMAPIGQDDLDRRFYRIQRVRWEEQPEGCGVSVFAADDLWVGAAYRTSLTVNGETVGEVGVPTGSHGIVVPLHIAVGDRLCIGSPQPGGFHLVWGPDMRAHYDSYCFRGHCG